ncbi:4957_t:CDS:1, partial [Racocetra fulgida]
AEFSGKKFDEENNLNVNVYILDTKSFLWVTSTSQNASNSTPSNATSSNVTPTNVTPSNAIPSTNSTLIKNTPDIRLVVGLSSSA